MIAETMLGRGDRAFRVLRPDQPGNRNDRIEGIRVEPYVYCQNILSDEHPQFGLERSSWLTNCGLIVQASTAHILEIQPTYEGLRIDPCIPSTWDGFHVRRRFRGAAYITVHNPSREQGHPAHHGQWSGDRQEHSARFGWGCIPHGFVVQMG